MIIEAIHNGMFGSNCYIAGDNGHGILVDAGVAAEKVKRFVDRINITIDYIVLTHGHIDHICHISQLRQLFKCPVLIHEKDLKALADPALNGSLLFGLPKEFEPADILLKHGDTIESMTMRFEIIHTPGHTPGSICIKTGDILFTGDSLFKLSIGRTDLGFGNHDQLLKSIKTRLLTLNESTKVYPGHGAATEIGYEKKFNPLIA